MKYALIIGINYLGTSAQLNGCIADAKAVYSMITQKLGFREENIVLMTEECVDYLKPTYDNILEQIDVLTNKIKTGDKVFFHYSGHGTQILDTNGDEEDGCDECIVPLDYTSGKLIIDDTLRSQLVDQIPKGAYLFGVLDCCNSGSGFDLRYSVKEVANEHIKEIQREDFPSFYDYFKHILKFGDKEIETYTTYALNISDTHTNTQAKVIVLSGCKDDQYSLDVNQGNIVGGALTLSFLRTMDEYNYSPTCSELLRGVRHKVQKDYNSPQIPQLSLGSSSNMERKFQP